MDMSHGLQGLVNGASTNSGGNTMTIIRGMTRNMTPVAN